MFFKDGAPTTEVRFFEQRHTWQHYVDSRRLEITCGEAPYLVTRYDVETGEAIPLEARVRIRRTELRRLCGDDLTEDESGWPCVRVKRGKGSKYQLQRILPEDVALVRSYFDVSDQRIFREEDFSLHMDYHHLRANQAKRAYNYYYDLLQQDPAYRRQLIGELRARWNRYNRTADGRQKLFPFHNTVGLYLLRGRNKVHALANGQPVAFDRLAVFAVSVFHLSHWRLDTLVNYLCAV